VRTFLLSQLRLVGRDAAVKAASLYLSDPALVEPATQLLLTVKSAAARRRSWPHSPGEGCPITIVKALGELKAAEALDRLSAFAKDPDPAMRRPALAALANVASPRSYPVLTGAAQSAEFRYEPANAIGALLEYARQLGRKGALVTSDRVCRLIMKNTDDAERLPTRAAALAILADVRGKAALPELLKAVDHADRGYRNAALTSAERIRGAVPINHWVAKAKKVDPERRSEIIAMLGRQGDRRALPFIRSSLAAREPEVAFAAAEALAHMERAKANPDLLTLLKTRTTSDEAQRVAAVLLWTIDEQHLDPLAGMLDTLQPPAKAAALRVIGAKGGKRYAGRVLPLTSDANPKIRAAAIGALAGVVGANDLPAVLRLLDGAPDAAATADLQKAVVAAANQIVPEEARARPLVDAMKTSAHPEWIVELLPQIGGPQALAAVGS
jgi:HEAT repeat protein